MDKYQIGLNAGKIWNLLDSNRDKRVWDVEGLQQASGLSIPDFYAAIGWLARESKVDFGEDGITHHGTVGLIVEFYH
ncbi:MAG TPA: winged helix-turn-helix domain-containing protein [Candidatus Bacteroides intestinavium]|uniref:Winged helix-turn-helix domain-containing protein n=1 Tax=Candidatus Bacteroides intestinavium TaxID=2838469 RepID=A0A9D2HQJ1_9BACE|nr:winged helix-turn-helix domain-containing protein [Candidatus Bacteroides intestinavium]